VLIKYFKYSSHPNLFLIVNKSKSIELIDMMKPIIINGLDLSLTFLYAIFPEEIKLSSFFLFKRLEKGLITIIFISIN